MKAAFFIATTLAVLCALSAGYFGASALKKLTPALSTPQPKFPSALEI